MFIIFNIFYILGKMNWISIQKIDVKIDYFNCWKVKTSFMYFWDCLKPSPPFFMQYGTFMIDNSYE